MAKLDLDDVKAEVASAISDAVDFITTEYAERWAQAERAYNGKSDLPTVAGRSNAVKTEVRDVTRALMPSIMRILYQARKPVEYLPTKLSDSAFLEQQSLFVKQTFAAHNGYRQLYNCVQESLKLCAGPVKAYWEENPAPVNLTITGLTEAEVENYKLQPDMVVKEVTDHKFPIGSPTEGNVDPETFEELYDIRVTQYFYNGKIAIEAFPVYEFFVSRNAPSVEAAFVHGHRRSVTVAEAIGLGLESDDWDKYDDLDVESSEHSAASEARRTYVKAPAKDEVESVDPLGRRFLLTECYCEYDLEGNGTQQKYCFWFGGTSYQYIYHELIEDYCIDVVACDPVPFTVLGRSITDIAHEKQENATSIFRAMIDNAHITNNPRVAADPTTTDFADLMNNALGAPIKTVGAPQMMPFDLPFTGAGLLNVLSYMQTDVEQSVGVTKASTGLDPDALQSTDKNAVMNTIQMAQGQTELMARNIVETGLIPLFRKVLKLSIRHMNRLQVIKTKGKVIQVDLSTFNPDLAAEPNVGLGTANVTQQMQTLNFVLAKQEALMAQFGLDNPFTSLSLLYNTLEDIVELGGLRDPGRYFKEVTVEIEAKIAEKQAAEAQAAAEEAAKNPAIDPTKALLQIEAAKNKIKELEIATKARYDEAALQLKALESAEKADLERDALVQARVIELARIGKDRLNARVTEQQKGNNNERAAGARAGRSGSSVQETASDERLENSVDTP